MMERMSKEKRKPGEGNKEEEKEKRKEKETVMKGRKERNETRKKEN